MNYLSTIVKQNKKTSKKKTSKKKNVITVAVQKVKTTYLKVYAKTNEEAEAIAAGWYKEGKFDNKIVKIDEDPAEYLNGPVTYGFTTEILGSPVDKMVDLTEEM